MGSAKCILLQSQRIQLPSEAAELLLGPSRLSPCGLSPILSQLWAALATVGILGAISVQARGRRGHWIRAHRKPTLHEVFREGRQFLFYPRPVFSHPCCLQPTFPAQLWLF